MSSQSQLTQNFIKNTCEIFDSILLDEPNNFFALYGKSLGLYKDGKMEECVHFLNKAIEVTPDEVETNIMEMRDQIAELIVYKKEAVLTAPNTVQSTIPMAIDVEMTPKSKTYKCNICDKVFTKQFSLNRHFYQHTGERAHKCRVCGKSFIQKTDMERHLTLHSDELNFKCSACDKRFKTKKNLDSHFTTHSSYRPFHCSFCEKTFRVKRLWKFHEELHNPIKPFKCEICDKGFAAKPYLMSHMKTHSDLKVT